jgi:hypothetical protein
LARIAARQTHKLEHSAMAFPPNYNQERNNRAKAKQLKAIDKQNKRDNKSAQRKHEDDVSPPPSQSAPENKDNS